MYIYLYTNAVVEYILNIFFMEEGVHKDKVLCGPGTPEFCPHMGALLESSRPLEAEQGQARADPAY